MSIFQDILNEVSIEGPVRQICPNCGGYIQENATEPLVKHYYFPEVLTCTNCGQVVLTSDILEIEVESTEILCPNLEKKY